MSEVFVGRQPIFDRDLAVLGYELLFRAHAGAQSAVFRDDDQASIDLLVNTFTEIGMQEVVGDGLAFLNLTRGFFTGEHALPFPRERVVMEVLEDIEVDDELLDGLARLRREGYRIALDDFLYRPELEPIVQLADFVKLDLLQIPSDQLAQHVEILRDYEVLLLAEKVETREVFDECRELGFDYFQGYFLSRPHVVRGRRLPPTRLSALRMISELHSPSLEFSQLEKIIRQDVGMSYRLLRVINAAFYGIPQQINSVRQALVLLGIDRIRAWASILALSTIDEKPRELMVMAMLRARMCELLAEALGEKEPENHFTVGLFSALDALMDQPMEELLAHLPLAKPLADALLTGSGVLGELLGCVIHYERGEWDNLSFRGLLDSELAEAYVKALLWATAAGRELG